jgi:hypothetical protein
MECTFDDILTTQNIITQNNFPLYTSMPVETWEKVPYILILNFYDSEIYRIEIPYSVLLTIHDLRYNPMSLNLKQLIENKNKNLDWFEDEMIKVYGAKNRKKTDYYFIIDNTIFHINRIKCAVGSTLRFGLYGLYLLDSNTMAKIQMISKQLTEDEIKQLTKINSTIQIG